MLNKKEKAAYDKLYDIISSQDAMYLMFKFGIHKQMTQIPSSFTIKEDVDLRVMQQAFDKVIERNDFLRLRFVKEKKTFKQYFIKPYTCVLPVKQFSSVEEQEEFFAKDAQKPVMFTKNELFRGYFFKTCGGFNGIYMNFTHLIVDAMGIAFFYKDLIDVYNALISGGEMPPEPASYEQYIADQLKKENDSKRMEKHEKFYKEYFLKGGMPYYAGVHGGAFLEKYRKKKKDPSIRVPLAYNPLYDKCDMISMHISSDDFKVMSDYCTEKQLAPENLFLFGLRSHCSKVNNRIDDVSFMAVCSKRSTVKEKNMAGCMAQPMIIRTIINEKMTFSQAVEEILSVRTDLYRHAAYPYTKARTMSLDLHGLSPIQGPNSMMYSWIPLPVNGEFGFDFEFKTYNLGRYFTPLYTITMPDPENKGANVCYMYRTKLSTPENIELLHKNTLKAILTGIKNPEMTVGEILDCLDAI